MDAWQALLHTHHQVTNTLDAELRSEHGITLGDYDVLVRLARAEDRRLRMAEPAQRVMISPSGLTRVVDGPVKDGMAVRRRDDSDARVVQAEITEKARARVRKAAQTHLGAIRRHFTG